MVLKQILFFLTAVASFSATAASLEDLAHDPKWLRLGHYHRTFFGNYHSKIQGPFFMAQNGANDPLAEIKTSFSILFETDPAKQCQYPSRTKWLAKAMAVPAPKIIDCPKRKEWKNKLNAQEVYLVFAANDLGSASSSFGHTFFRLHNPENLGPLQLVDYGVNFMADTGSETGALMGLKGMFGFYSGYYSMLPYHQKIQEYTNLEGRDLFEFKINFSPTEVDELIDHVLELDGSSVPYYFLDDNCARQIIELIEFIRPNLNLSNRFHGWVIPLDTLKVFASQENLLGPAIYRPSLQTKFTLRFEGLNLQQKMAVKDSPRSTSIASQSSHVLDTSLDYLSLLEYRQQLDFKQQKHLIAIQRAKLGFVSENAEVQKIDLPTDSKSSSAFYLGAGKVQDLNYFRFKFRPAFQDLISNDKSLNSFSHVEAASIEFRYYQEVGRVDLQSFQLVNVISTRPVTMLEAQSSWLLQIATEPKLSPFAKYGLGYSYDSFGSRLSAFAVAKIFADRPGRYLEGGPEILLVNHHNMKFRSMLDVEYLPVLGDGPKLQAKLALSYDLNSSTELRFEILRQNEEGTGQLTLVF